MYGVTYQNQSRYIRYNLVRSNGFINTLTLVFVYGSYFDLGTSVPEIPSSINRPRRHFQNLHAATLDDVESPVRLSDQNTKYMQYCGSGIYVGSIVEKNTVN